MYLQDKYMDIVERFVMIDDFCIENNCKWDIHGRNLLDDIIKIANSNKDKYLVDIFPEK